MKWSEISFTPPTKTLRQFAGLWLLVFGVLAAWQGWLRAHHTTGWIFAGLALAVGPLGLLVPQAIRWVFVGAQVITFPIGWVVSHLILAALYYGMFTPVGLVFRLLGRDALGLRPKPDQPTYWVPKPAAAGVRSYFRQF
jgi:hypothetical protein